MTWSMMFPISRHFNIHMEPWTLYCILNDDQILDEGNQIIVVERLNHLLSATYTTLEGIKCPLTNLVGKMM